MIINKTGQIIREVVTRASQPLNTSQIAKLVHSPRTTVEYTLNTLKKNGIVSSTKSENKTIWSSNGVFQSPIAEQIYGLDNVVSALEKAVNKKHLKAYIIESDKTVAIFQTKRINNIFHRLNNKFRRNNTLLYILFHSDTIKRMKEMVKNEELKSDTINYLSNRAMSGYILPDNLFDTKAHISVIGDTVFITDFEKETCFKIVNPDLAKSYAQLYDYLCPLLQKVNIKYFLESISKN